MRQARRDPRLRATVVERRPLVYADGADPARDRPSHVRAASAIVRWHGSLLVVQDDAAFVGWIGTDGRVRAIDLPEGPGGKRLFDDTRGNKAAKLDLEAAFAMSCPEGDVIVALGSGSSPARRRIVVVALGDEQRAARVFDGGPLYDALAAGLPGELNIEGAFLRGAGEVRLLQRGNGRGATDATVDIPATWFERLLAGPTPVAPDVHFAEWDLGNLDGARLTFTDGLEEEGGWWFLAAAEDSPDAIRDGPVTGSALGRANEEGGVWAPLCGQDGAVLALKAEGLCAAEREGEMLVVVDADDPNRPAELLRIGLEGPWPGDSRA